MSSYTSPHTSSQWRSSQPTLPRDHESLSFSASNVLMTKASLGWRLSPWTSSRICIFCIGVQDITSISHPLTPNRTTTSREIRFSIQTSIIHQFTCNLTHLIMDLTWFVHQFHYNIWTHFHSNFINMNTWFSWYNSTGIIELNIYSPNIHQKRKSKENLMGLRISLYLIMQYTPYIKINPPLS